MANTHAVFDSSTPKIPLSTTAPVYSEKPMWMKMAEKTESTATISRDGREYRFSRKSGNVATRARI